MPRLNYKPKHPDDKTPHDVFNEAIANGDFDNLPSKGKPLNLKSYFSIHPDAQLSTQLLIDNKVLPKPLMDRKEVDNLIAEANTPMEKGVEALIRLRSQVSIAASPVVNLFPQRKALMQTLKLDEWPTVFPEVTPDPWRYSRLSVQKTKRLQALIQQHNNHASRLLTQYFDLLQKANDKIHPLNIEIMGDGPVIGGAGRLHYKSLDIETMVQGAKTSCCGLPLLPDDTITRIQTYYKKERPSFWQRFINK
jgi:hypothetical protein